MSPSAASEPRFFLKIDGRKFIVTVSEDIRPARRSFLRRIVPLAVCAALSVCPLWGGRLVSGDEFSEGAHGFAGYKIDSYNPLSEREQGMGWTESFETEGVSWRPLYQENDVRIVEHRRSDEYRHGGARSEEIALDFRNRGYAFLGHYVDYPLLVDEAAPSLWIRADQPQITLGLLVVLPKTVRPDTQTPLTLLLSGSTYLRPGEWEQLSFEPNLRRQLEETVQAIRSEHKITVDSDEAYIRQLVLFTEKNRGALRLWIDDIRIAEHIPRPIEFLRQEERGVRFTPINLLGFRFKATESTAALEAALGDSRELPEEPFAVNGVGTQHEAAVSSRDDLLPSFMRSARSPDELDGQIGLAGFDSAEDADGADDAVRRADFALTASKTPPGETTVISGSGTLPTAAEYPDSFPRSASEPYPDIRFNQRILTVGAKKPLGVRAVEYQGEPFPFLKNLQFNAIWLKAAPTADQLAEASRLDLWLIAPPPVGQETVSAANGAPVEAPAGVLPYFNRSTVGAEYDPVLIWNLGSERTSEQYASVKAASDYIRQLDPHRRPVVCQASSGLTDYADIGSGVDLLLLDRKPMLGSLDLLDYGRWLKNYQRIGTPDFPYWNRIQTEPDPSMLAQCRYFGAVDEMPGIVSYEQMRQQMRLSMAAGIHGFLFSSSAPLDGPDREAQYRAAALELLNLELILTDAWFAAGEPEELIDSEDETLSAAILRTERTSLLLPISIEPENQLVFGQAAANNRSFIVPVRDGYSADLLLPGNLRKVPSHRRAGGIRLDLEEISMNTLVFLAQSDWYTRVTAEKSPILGTRMAQLAIRLAKMRLDLYRNTLGAIQQMNDQGEIPQVAGRPFLTIPEQATVLQQTCASIDLAEEYLRQDDPSQAYLQAERALREIRMNQQRFRKLATRSDLCRPVLPVSAAFDTLPAYLDNYGRITSGRLRVTNENRLVGGDMERTDQWTQGGWTRNEIPVPGLTSGLSRSPLAARSGQYGLLFSLAATSSAAPLEPANVPMWVEVPVNVKTGELVCIEGWIKIEKPLVNGVDGFMIYDSHGGRSLAQRYSEMTDWRPFAFYRYAAWDGEMRIVFALSAIGEVKLDDVTVRTVQAP